MIFSSLFFIFVFLPVVLIAYFLVPRKLKNLCLFLFSLVFYAWGEPVYVFLMLFTTLFDYIAGYFISKYREEKKKARIFLIISICVNLGLLGFFKYSGLLVETFNSISGLSLPLPAVALPIGISFYTFESLSYSIDIYRGEAPAQRNIIDFGAYISFFPHLVAGPIVRYEDLAAQLQNRQETLEKFTSGGRRFLVGLFKKVLLANNLAMLADKVQYMGNPSTLTAWLGMLAFTFQIYLDFSGYSDMAIGLAGMFGFQIPENFRYPYISRSVSEFWRRWHITLGTWFREYVYIPLGGNRCSTIKNVRNLAIVWVLTGIWHGASWNFAIWGAYYAVLIICEKLFLQKWLDKIPAFFQWLYSFLAAVIGWVFFSYLDIHKAFGVIGAMFGFAPGADKLGVYSLITYAPLLILAALCSSTLVGTLTERLRKSGTPGKIIWSLGFICLFVMSMTFLVDNSYNPFLYFRF
ncbi:MBOAT family protein [Caproiciproducens sp. AGMB10547]|uniref:MBOAT family protein n=1 Tax=Caproiciproducens faecalis TaxID=2820301 RepID=A0ABS7DKF6_9FIRM|nr:MBOAT family O-acyltransferase [Caproiciproducens faecalis]MBW7571562.1 MBOAT family protein [Caproiciproducens faecalis]